MCDNKCIAALKKKNWNSWDGNLIHHCHPVPLVPNPWQQTHQQPYSSMFLHNSTSHSSDLSWASASAAVGMKAVLSTQSHVSESHFLIIPTSQDH